MFYCDKYYIKANIELVSICFGFPSSLIKMILFPSNNKTRCRDHHIISHYNLSGKLLGLIRKVRSKSWSPKSRGWTMAFTTRPGWTNDILLTCVSCRINSMWHSQVLSEWLCVDWVKINFPDWYEIISVEAAQLSI